MLKTKEDKKKKIRFPLVKFSESDIKENLSMNGVKSCPGIVHIPDNDA